MAFKPTNVNILGCDYSIQYHDRPSDVDLHGRESLWGQIDFWTRSIRIYDGGRSDADRLQTIIHECLHAIAEELHLELRTDDRHDELDLISVALSDVLQRDNWIVGR